MADHVSFSDEWIDPNVAELNLFLEMPKILVIDDDDGLRNVVSTALRKNRFTVFEAKNASEGLDLAENKAPDLILCDLNLGERTDWDFLIKLKSPSSGAVPLILMTGQPREIKEGEELLLKPFTLAALLSAVRGHLTLRPTRQRFAQEKEVRDIRRKGRVRKDNRTSQGLKESGGVSPEILRSPEEWRQLLARVQSLREAERNRVARAIHDDLSQKLTVLAIEFSLLDSSLSSLPEKSATAHSVATLKRLGKLVNELISSTQEITAQLRPKVLDEFGFVAALEWLVEDFQKRTGVRCELNPTNAEGCLDSKVAAELFRLSQEILSKAAGQANASAVSIHLEERNDWLRVEMTGNGVNMGQIDKFGALDLLAMRERAERLGGTFEITTEPQKGTKIIVKIPLSKQGNK